MELVMMVVTLVAVLIFSLACALLVEEIIFGGLFRLFFAPAAQAKRDLNR